MPEQVPVPAAILEAGDGGPLQERESCPVTATVDVLGGKWKPLIVYSLMQGTCRFGELRRRLPGVTQQMLTLQLRELERDGVVHREVYREVPPKVEYSLTPLGRSLEPVVHQMIEWGRRYLRRDLP
jgi:DNA-binding HxlR family transcriptional regulator